MFALFAGSMCDSLGGWMDLRAVRDSIEACHTFMRDEMEDSNCYWWHIVDLSTRKVVDHCGSYCPTCDDAR